MIQIATVLVGSGLLVFVLFIRSRGPEVILSAWRWMLLTWGILALVGLTSPVTLERMSSSWLALGYAGSWVLSFVMGDLWGRGHPGGSKAGPGEGPGTGEAGSGESPEGPEGEDRRSRVTRVLLGLSVIGAAGFAYKMLSAAGGADESGLLAELRRIQTANEVGGLDTTILQIMAFAGLPVSLILVGSAIRRGRPVPLLAWIGILSSVSVYMTSAGRQGLFLAFVASIVTVVASLQMGDAPYRYTGRIVVPLVAVAVIFSGYFMFNVATRGAIGGTMDGKLQMVERVYGVYIDPDFRDSVRPLGVVGDTASEFYLYLGTQMPGLTALQRDYDGGLDLGLGLVPYFTRRVEWLLGVDVLERVAEAQKSVFLNLGMPGNFFLTGAGTTFTSFGVLGSLLVMWGCGVVSGRHRGRVVAHPTGPGVAMQAMICAGAAFTIIFSPTVETGWAFPVIWLLVIPRVGRGEAGGDGTDVEGDGA